MLNIAICYWGMTRSTKLIYKSHLDKLFSRLKLNNINYKIFMHTWDITSNKIFIAEREIRIPVDYEEYKLLQPDYYNIENQNDFLNNINFDDYFYKDIYDTIGHCPNGEWLPQLILNHLCALESQKRVLKMVKESNENFDFIILIRPDILLSSNFNVSWLNSNFDITLLNYHYNEGYNDRFAIIPFKKADKYFNRIDEIAEYRKTNGRIVSEKYLKYIVDKYYSNIQYINLKMNIIRPNGEIVY
jgi:hypothetical protein